MASSCRPSVCLSVKRYACGSQGGCAGLKVVPAYSQQASSYLSFGHFCSSMYCLATKRTK